jgi:hypothetical protein
VEGEKGGETGNVGCVRCTCATHDDGKNIGHTNVGNMPILARGMYFFANHLGCVGGVAVRA